MNVNDMNKGVSQMLIDTYTYMHLFSNQKSTSTRKYIPQFA